ncbi:phage holin family protein [Aetokthonos hydrillicola Thurmond2011]|jgi:putative membrane protein|uniref:Phage holin family protein n=1 Tax=Aetokthonos hydrillicola Thurmond2011 TaxID=2712845 RepID=A0AAP5MBC9_9CYAN|nr:phage holin family protein [Aetokthonos hydrillicola]MBO3458864.1 phage holin family protein [Aetokthonos hydrillicola CCALA 1050]MBW4587288.1 phage holin family protein [Aetokthonos hydrillicola CCALA 1050]MDR9896689.1 phage holin family protein [Aetokthonos hydrillicola Thurmond2011]
MDLRTIFIVWVGTAISLYIISKFPLIGVEIDTPDKAFTSSAIFGIVTTVVRPILHWTFATFNIVIVDLLSGFFTFIITVVSFGLAASLVEGFNLRFGLWSAVLGAFTLSMISSLIYGFLGT